MFRDEFKRRYTTIPFAYHKKRTGENEESVISHQHRELELIAMVEGCADFFIDSVRYELHAGDVLLIPPYSAHRARIEANTYYECICFDLSLLWDEGIRRGLESGQLTVDKALLASDSECLKMNKCIRDAVSACEENQPGWEMCAIGNLSVLFAYLKKISFFVKMDDRAARHAFSKSVIEYVAGHFWEPITSRTVAEQMFLNNSYFCRLFKQSFGCPFAEYLMEYRIEKAKLALNNTDEQVSDIAIKTGFNSFSYFSKSFKSIVGMTPSKYRMNNSD